MASDKVMTITSGNFDADVLKSEKPVLVDFWAAWCGPCRMIGPVVDALAEEYDGRLKVGKINVDEQPELAAKYGVQTIPTLLVFQNGQPVDKSIGAVDQDTLEEMLEKHLA